MGDGGSGLPCPKRIYKAAIDVFTLRARLWSMLREIARILDDWLIDRDLEAAADGLARPRACTIRVLGQAALLEAALPLRLAATRDVDVRADYDDGVRRKFEALLAAQGRELDPVGHEAWMPRETRYAEIFRGKFVRLLLAEAEAVLLSKARKAPERNRRLLTEYLALGASARFFELAAKYHVDLEQFA